MTHVTEKTTRAHCKVHGFTDFVSTDGTTFGCARCAAKHGGPRIVKVGELNPRLTADEVLSRAESNGGSGERDMGLIDYLLNSRADELDQARVDALKRAKRVAEEHDRVARTHAAR